ncbi:MAG: ABC transporter permease, partial [Euryarchaeota archaeon]|nr:ABC transporter permease [Euryarchaeota archaeon]
MIEYLVYPLRTLVQQKARTLLTLSGIVIGIAVIVAMVSIGEGMRYTINEQLDKVGADKIYVMPAGIFGGQFGGPPKEYVPFGIAEEREIRAIPGVKKMAPLYYTATKVKKGSEVADAFVTGGTEDAIELYSDFLTLKEGRFIKETETGVVFIGYYVSHGMFDHDIRVGDTLEINGKKFRVVGIVEEIGSRQDDSTIYMSITAAQALFDAGDDINFFFVQTNNKEIVGEVAQKIEDRLKKLRGGKDFDVLTTEDQAEQVNQVLDILTFVLGGIASVSLLVGGVIIMNTMLMSVMERTKEIGVMKATGATNGQVLALFLAESSVVGMVGGAVGIGLGLLISKVIEKVGQFYIGSLFKTYVAGEVIIGVLLFSVIIGSASGAYPAWKAAKL